MIDKIKVKKQWVITIFSACYQRDVR